MADPLMPPPVTRNPDTVFLLALLLVTGLGQLASGTEPAAVEALVPSWMLMAWSGGLTASAGVTLAGIAWPGHLTGLMIEAVGRIMLAPAATAYAVAIAVAAGPRGAILVGLLAALSAASVWRVWQIHRSIVGLRESVAALTEEQSP